MIQRADPNPTAEHPAWSDGLRTIWAALLLEILAPGFSGTGILEITVDEGKVLSIARRIERDVD